MLYREIMAVCSEIHTKHINTLCGQNAELLNVKLAVHLVTSVLSYLPGSLHYYSKERCLCVTKYITASKFVNLYVRDFDLLYRVLHNVLRDYKHL